MYLAPLWCEMGSWEQVNSPFPWVWHVITLPRPQYKIILSTNLFCDNNLLSPPSCWQNYRWWLLAYIWTPLSMQERHAITFMCTILTHQSRGRWVLNRKWEHVTSEHFEYKDMKHVFKHSYKIVLSSRNSLVYTNLTHYQNKN